MVWARLPYRAQDPPHASHRDGPCPAALIPASTHSPSLGPLSLPPTSFSATPPSLRARSCHLSLLGVQGNPDKGNER